MKKILSFKLKKTIGKRTLSSVWRVCVCLKYLSDSQEDAEGNVAVSMMPRIPSDMPSILHVLLYPPPCALEPVQPPTEHMFGGQKMTILDVSP